jgi:hypothetical protein
LFGQSVNVFEVIKEHKAMLSLNLWPGFDINKIPVAVYDSTDTYLFFCDNIPEGFTPIEGAPAILKYKGQHPLVRGNSITQIEGKWVATSILARYSKRTGEKYSAKDLAGIIVHEQFHIFQRIRHSEWRQNDGVLLFYPQETTESLFLRRVEKEAFMMAVTSKDINDMAGWAALGLKFRNERFNNLHPRFVTYEKELQRTEGLSEYIEKLVRNNDPLKATSITNGIAPAGVRDLGYVEGRWIAMILDKLDANWKNTLENTDSLYLEDLLETAIAKTGSKRKSIDTLEIERLKEKAVSDFNEWQTQRKEEINRYISSDGYSIEINSSQNPLIIRMFDPLAMENLTDGSVFHRLFFSASNQTISIRIVDHPCITWFDSSYRLIKIQLFGIKEAPMINSEEKKFILKKENSTLELKYSEIETAGTKYIISI